MMIMFSLFLASLHFCERLMYQVEWSDYNMFFTVMRYLCWEKQSWAGLKMLYNLGCAAPFFNLNTGMIAHRTLCQDSVFDNARTLCHFCEDISKKAIEEFCFKLAEMSRITGVDFANLKLPIFTTRPDQVELGIRICYQEAHNKLRDQKIDLLLASAG